MFGDLDLAVNLLDFGVSYHQAKQEADRALIARELRRKSLQNLILQVRSAFWQAASAQRFEDEIQALIADATQALENAREIEARVRGHRWKFARFSGLIEGPAEALLAQLRMPRTNSPI